MENFLRKWPKTGIFTYFGTQRAYQSIFMWIQWKLFKKMDENLYIYIDLFLPYLGNKTAWKFIPQGPFFTHTWKYPQCVCKQVSWSHFKHFLRKWSGTSKIPIFYTFFVIKDPLKKLEAKNKNSISTTFWAICLCTFKPNIGKIRWKLR